MRSRRLALAGGLLAALVAAAPASAHNRLTVNRALDSSGTAATDGDATTTWCGTTLNLDLGRWMWWPGVLAREPAQPELEPEAAGDLVR